MKPGNKIRWTLFVVMTVLLVGLALPERLQIPVQGASEKDWNHDTFWYEPWGRSGVHKGIDIFFKAGTPVIASTYGVVIFQGNIRLGGNVVAVLGPKWRIHYYAHLKDTRVDMGSFVRTSQVLGTVGNSGNAQGKPSHLHYAILSLFPHVFRWDSSTQGWKKMFYLDPGKRLMADAD